MQTRNPRGRRRLARPIWPSITGRNRTKTGKSHNPGFARNSARAIVNAFRCALVSRAQRSVKRSGMMRCRPGTVTDRVLGGPGSAMHHSLTLALHRIRDTQASDAFGALFTFQTAQIFSFPRRVCARGFASLLHSPRIEGWAERRRAHLVIVVAPVKARVSRACETRRASCEACMTRSPLGAPPWRFLATPPLRLRIISGNALNERGCACL
jgi:hypothetical protein